MARGFAWLDTGTHDSLSEASTFIEVLEKRQGLKVACLEGIAYRQGWITAEKLREVAQPMLKNDYGRYLLSILDEDNHALKRNLEYQVMNILVTGANGQLGNEMRIVSQNTTDHYIFTDVNQVEGLETTFLDITDMDAIRKMVKENDVKAIVNCAAWTNVDACETDM